MAAAVTVQEQVQGLVADTATAAAEQAEGALMRQPVELQVTVSFHDLTVLLTAKEALDAVIDYPHFLWSDEQYRAADLLTEFTNRILDGARMQVLD
jgi:Tfp pilus assembly protein PilO